MPRFQSIHARRTGHEAEPGVPGATPRCERSALATQRSVLPNRRHDWLKRAGVGILASLALHAAAKEEVNMSMTISSSAFAPNGAIPKQYTCEGKDLSPPLAWGSVPASAKSLALIVDDPDAPDPAAPRMTWVHWVLYNLPATNTGLAEAVKALPPGTLQGRNDWQRTGYGGPCPPIGRHRYFFKLYALDVVLSDLREPTKQPLEAAMKGHIVAQAQLVGTYQKGR